MIKLWLMMIYRTNSWAGRPVLSLIGLIGLLFFSACNPFSNDDERRHSLSDADFERFVKQHLSSVSSVDRSLYDTRYRLLSGEWENLGKNKGQALMVNFWATWCYPCKQEMPEINQLHQEMKDEKFRILAVNYGEGSEKVSRFMERNDYDFDVVLDSDLSLSALFGVDGLPTTFVIDREGRILGKIIGPKDWREPTFLAFFHRISR